MPDEVTTPTIDPSAAATDPAPDPDPRGERRSKELTERLKAREGELKEVRTQLESSRRRQAERIAASHLSVPADLFDVGGVKLEELLDKDGDIDQAAVEKRIAELVKARPGLAPPSRISPARALPGGGRPRSAAPNRESMSLSRLIRQSQRQVDADIE